MELVYIRLQVWRCSELLDGN